MVDVPHSAIVCRWSVNFCVAAILAGPDTPQEKQHPFRLSKINGKQIAFAKPSPPPPLET